MPWPGTTCLTLFGCTLAGRVLVYALSLHLATCVLHVHMSACRSSCIFAFSTQLGVKCRSLKREICETNLFDLVGIFGNLRFQTMPSMTLTQLLDASWTQGGFSTRENLQRKRELATLRLARRGLQTRANEPQGPRLLRRQPAPYYDTQAFF